MTINNVESQVVELVAFRCSTCHGNDWNLHLRPLETGGTLLVICCANAECVRKKRKELGGEDEEFVVWAEFDISGQGFDVPAEEDIEPTEIN